jgi:hypothetical protein
LKVQLSCALGRAIAEAVSRWLPTAAAGAWQVGFLVDKVAPGQVSPANHRSFHQLLHPDNHPGQVQYASNGRSAEWTRYGLHLPLKKNTGCARGLLVCYIVTFL